MTYRLIEPVEWGALKHEFDARSVPLPDPKISCIFGAYSDTENELEAFLVCQFKFHSEPLVSYNPLAVPGLLAFAETAMTEMGLSGIECYVGASDERVRMLVWRLGFHPAEPMFVKRLKVTEAAKS